MADPFGGASVCVVVPTKDRPALLATCLTRVLAACDATARPCEVVVIDDGSTPPVEPVGDSRVRILRTEGIGPSRARNLGISDARAPIIAFTDDDVQVDDSWLVAALEALDTDASLAGVTGRTDAPPFDPLYQHGVFDHDGGSFLTCNVAYRASCLLYTSDAADE